MEYIVSVAFGQLQYNADKQILMCQHFYHIKIALESSLFSKYLLNSTLQFIIDIKWLESPKMKGSIVSLKWTNFPCILRCCKVPIESIRKNFVTLALKFFPSASIGNTYRICMKKLEYESYKVFPTNSLVLYI